MAYREIDTFEGVNLGSLNQMSLHTLDGCKQAGQMQSSSLINSTDCSSTVNNNQGCIVTDPRTSSYGAGFAASGGGVFITEYAQSGISYVHIYFQHPPSGKNSPAAESGFSLVRTSLARFRPMQAHSTHQLLGYPWRTGQVVAVTWISSLHPRVLSLI